MPKNDLMGLCGGLGLILAFLLVAGIVAAPLLQRIRSSPAIVAQR
jgi:hypothetical protein